MAVPIKHLLVTLLSTTIKPKENLPVLYFSQTGCINEKLDEFV